MPRENTTKLKRHHLQQLRTGRAGERRRLEIIAAALRLAPSDIDHAMESEDNLIEFAAKYGQSLDYIVLGDLAPMLVERYVKTLPRIRAA